MTSLSFTSGQILDIISALEDKVEGIEESGNFHLANYYYNIIEQFDAVSEKLQELPGESRIANLILAAN
jgi:hypothetical protein